MVEGFFNEINPNLFVRSAGTEPAVQVNSNAVKVMAEVGIDISNNTPKNVDQYLDEEWDYVITVCGHANETCPIFSGRVKHRLHIGFDDPAEARGTDDHIMSEFHRIRDEIKVDFKEFFNLIKLEV